MVRQCRMRNSRHGSMWDIKVMQQEYKEIGEEIGKERTGKEDNRMEEWKERPMQWEKARQEQKEEKEEDFEDHATNVACTGTARDSALTRAKEKEERKETQDSGHNGEEKEISSGNQEDKDSGKEMEGKEE